MRKIIAALALLLVIVPAAAQTKRTGAGAGTTTHGLPCDPLNLLPGCKQPDGSIFSGSATGGGNPFDNLTDDVLRKILADVKYAKALAKASGNDVTLQCWTAWVDVVTVQTQELKDDAGNVLEKPNPAFFVAAERASEFLNQIQPNSKLYIGCSPALNQSRMAIGQLISAVLSGGALGLFKLPGL
jgi:hypothetical protein